MKINGERLAQWTFCIVLLLFGLLLMAGIASDVYLYWMRALHACR